MIEVQVLAQSTSYSSSVCTHTLPSAIIEGRSVGAWVSEPSGCAPRVR